MKVYLDNAATTQPDPQVLESMMPFLGERFGNPSSTHSFGREARSAIELARKKVADLIGANSSEIFFTSGGTEADNTALTGFVDTYGIKNVITTPIEHHAVIHTLENLQKYRGINIYYLEVDPNGEFSYDQLEELLKSHRPALVSIMHANNEIGNICDIEKIALICREFDAKFFSDTVQTLGKLSLNLRNIPVDSIAGSAHKFHGPKGTGFLYVRGSSKIGPYIHGGGQERNMRSGTENVAGITGLAKALEVACGKMKETEQNIRALKSGLMEKLNRAIPGIQYNGKSSDLASSLYTILNVSLPPSDKLEMLLFQLDLKGIAVSGGSACASGALTGSHVLDAIRARSERPVVRFSFSKYNNVGEIDYAVETLSELTKR
jgi:cysteine desulfurase